MNVLIVDDHPLFHEALRSVITDHHANWQISTVHSSEQAQALILDGKCFDLAIVDLDLPGLPGDALVVWLRKQTPRVPSLVISAAHENTKLHQAVRSGSLGFIGKTASQKEIVAAIDAVVAGDKYFVEELLQEVQTLDLAADALSKRQNDVLQLMAEGQSNRTIADQLNIAETTVKSHVSTIFESLQCANRVECINTARDLGLLSK